MTKGKVIGFIIIFNKMLPQSLFSHLPGTLANVFHFCIRLCRECRNGVFDTVSHFRLVVIRTVKYLYPIIDAMLVLQAVHPKSETCQIGRDGRNMESNTFQRGIAPRFVI